VVLPLTVTAAPTWVPPVAQLVGAVVWGPNTVNVIVPVGLVPPDSGALMEVLAIATPAVAVAGAATVVVVAFLTTVDVMPVPQMLLDAMLLASPL
jgi:hypothetical protein